MKISARNRLKGRIVEVKKGATTAHVRLDVNGATVTASITNDSAIPHNVTLIDSTNKNLGETPTFDGGTKSFSATLKAGTYTYYCSVPGHRQAGMQGTLTVK